MFPFVSGITTLIRAVVAGLSPARGPALVRVYVRAARFVAMGTAPD